MQPGHVSRARLHSSGAAAARARRPSPDPTADTVEVAATLSYDELLDARYACNPSSIEYRMLWHRLRLLVAQASSKSTVGQLE